MINLFFQSRNVVPYSGLGLSMCGIKATFLLCTIVISYSLPMLLPVLMKASASKCQIAAVGCKHVLLLLCLIIQYKIIYNLFETHVKLELLWYIISRFCHYLHIFQEPNEILRFPAYRIHFYIC